MAIFEEKMYGVQCDRCKAVYENYNRFVAFPDKDTAIEEAENSCWRITDDGKCYCPDCYTKDDNDNVIIKK